jgi:hypothetical protein
MKRLATLLPLRPTPLVFNPQSEIRNQKGGALQQFAARVECRG